MNVLHYIVILLQDYNFRLFWAELLFMLFLPRRSRYALRMLVWLPLLVLPPVLGEFVQADAFRIGNYTWSFMLWYAYSIFAFAFCNKANVGTLIYAVVSAYALQNVFADFEIFMRLTWFDERSIACSAAGLALMVVIYVAGFFLFIVPWSKKLKMGLTVNRASMLAISAATLLIINVLSSFMVNASITDQNLADLGLLFGICTLVIMALLSNVYDKSYIQYEKEMMDRMLFEQDRQRKLAQQTIDLINMKCHDMKHQLAAWRKDAGGVPDEFYNKTLDSISIYDSYFNTGNRSLDLVLTEKSLRCNNLHINFTCIADGAALGFMSASDIYSFFGNAIDNAVECLMNYGEDKRNLSLNVRKVRQGWLSITVENYCEDNLSFEGGLPVTTKTDDKGYHGFGTKSMRYIVEELYGGHLSMERKGNIFCVTAVMPMENKS